MAQYKNGPEIPFRADEAIPMHSTVSVTSTGVKVCDLADLCDGTAMREAFAAGDIIPVRLMSAGTHKVIAKEAFAKGATLYTEADGKVQDTAESTAKPCFKALQAATAEGDIVEALPIFYGGVAAT